MAVAKKTTTAKAKPAPAKKAALDAKTAPKAKSAPKNDVAKAVLNPGKTQTGAGEKMREDFANFKDKAAEQARAAAGRGKDRASEAMGGFGNILRESADTIDEKVGSQYGDYARKAADAVDGFAGKLDGKQVDDLLEDAREFVRKSPAVAIGAAAAIGFVLARVIRSGRDA